MSSRHLQDVFKTYHQVKLLLLTLLRDISNTYLRCTLKTIIYTIICIGHTSEKLIVRVQNFQELTLWICRNFKNSFFKTPYEVTASTKKNMLLLKSGIRKDVAVSVNRESMNKSSSKNYF